MTELSQDSWYLQDEEGFDSEKVQKELFPLAFLLMQMILNEYYEVKEVLTIKKRKNKKKQENS